MRTSCNKLQALVRHRRLVSHRCHTEHSLAILFNAPNQIRPIVVHTWLAGKVTKNKSYSCQLIKYPSSYCVLKMKKCKITWIWFGE